TVARYGGEEFSIILPETPKKIALVVGERLRRKVEAHRLLLEDGRDISVTISMGVATYPYDAGSALELVRHADQALYQAKDRGRNQVVACEASA
ncbi:MAG: GGDEF domain-containing protein, partial [Planctomycetes bacterium]|nr:GGDEF domain-containing protein [Planctomycetota bacterium]